MKPRMTGSQTFYADFASPADWAAMYRRAGFQVVPCHMPQEGASWKRPALADWKTFQDEITSDAVFARWYGQSGEHVRRPNMGLITGRASGNIFVIDLDTYSTPMAEQWWTRVASLNNFGMFPETWEQRTGGGGRQLFFRAPADWIAPTNKTSIGVDIRGQGGFAVLPPSLHSSGREYAWLDGFEPWTIPISDAPEWLLGAVEELVEQHGGHQPGERAERTASPNTDFNAFGRRIDGREDYMTKVVWGAMVDWRREAPDDTSEQTRVTRRAEAFAAYARNVKPRVDGPGTPEARLEREGRGWSAFCQKWAYAFAKWEGKVARDAAERPRARQQHDTPPRAAREAPSVDDGDIYEFLDIPAIKSLPNPAWIVEGIVIEDALGFIYGPPGHGKTFVALNLALHVAAGMQSWWWGRGIARNGLVLYIAREGVGGLKTRIEAWQRAHGIADDTAPFALIRSGINFMEPGDVEKLIRTVDAAAERFGATPALIFVDTVSRVLPGAEENLQRDMTLFVDACDALRERHRATVIGVHHAGKSGDMRGSTVLNGAGDFVLKVERASEDEDSKAINFVAEKIKDAEDGWSKTIELKPVEWIEEGRVDGERKSLVAVPVEEAQEPAAAGGWPSKDVCRAVVRAIGEAWSSGRPWSPKVQTRDEGRYGPRIMSSRWSVPPEMGARMIEEWQINGVLAFEMLDKKTRMMGLKVIGSIDG